MPIQNDELNKCVYSLCSPFSLPFHGPSYSMRYNYIEIRPVNNPTVASRCSNERKSHKSLTLNQKLELIKLSQEDMLKAEIGQKPGFLHQLAKL